MRGGVPKSVITEFNHSVYGANFGNLNYNLHQMVNPVGTSDNPSLALDNVGMLYYFGAESNGTNGVIKINLSLSHLTSGYFSWVTTNSINFSRGTVVGGTLYSSGYAFDKSSGSTTSFSSAAGTDFQGVCSDGIYIYFSPSGTLKKYHINNETISNVTSTNETYRDCTTDGIHLYYIANSYVGGGVGWVSNVYKIAGN